MALFSEGEDRRDQWTDRLTIVARDVDLDPTSRRLLTLDEGGLDLLRLFLTGAREAGDPFGFVVLDSLSRLKPPEIEENDNGGMSVWLDALEDVAAACEVWLILIHHAGHSSDTARTEARSAGRGASAIAAGAQGVWLLERVPGAPSQRVLKVDGNAVLPHEVEFQVCGPDADEGSVNYFRLADPLSQHGIDDHLEPGESVSLTDLAWKLTPGGRPDGAKSPGGYQKRLASTLAHGWERAGSVSLSDGPRGSKTITRAHQTPRRETF
jgi:hypothetical protein